MATFYTTRRAYDLTFGSTGKPNDVAIYSRRAHGPNLRKSLISDRPYPILNYSDKRKPERIQADPKAACLLVVVEENALVVPVLLGERQESLIVENGLVRAHLQQLGVRGLVRDGGVVTAYVGGRREITRSKAKQGEARRSKSGVAHSSQEVSHIRGCRVRHGSGPPLDNVTQRSGDFMSSP